MPIEDSEFRKIFSHPNFAKRYKSSGLFKSAMDALTKSSYPNFKMHVTNDDVSFSFGPTGTERMSFEEARNMAMYSNTIKSTRIYTGGNDTAYVGTATNDIANWIASQGYKVRTQRRSFESQADLASFLSEIRVPGSNGKQLYGLPVPRGDKGVNMFDVFDTSGRRLRFDEIQQLMGFEFKTNKESVIKRLSLITSDRELADLVVMDKNASPFKVHLFDPQLAARSRGYGNILDDLAQSSGETVESMAERMFDGESYLTTAGAKRRIAKMRAKGEEIIAAAESNRQPPGTPGFIEYKRQRDLGKRIIEVAKEKEKRLTTGARFNLRQLSGLDEADNSVFLKGDAGVLTNDRIRKLFPEMASMTDDEIDALDVIASKSDVKDEMTSKLISMMSLEDHGIASKARSNILSSAIHQELIDPNGTLYSGTLDEISQHMEDIKSGTISSGFKNIIREMAEIDLDEYEHPSDRALAVQAKDFARRLEQQLSLGVNISDNEFISSQLFSSLEKHYTTLRKRRAPKHTVSEVEKNMINVRGVMYPNYNITFPIPNSIGAHITGAIDKDDNVLQGMIRVARDSAHIMNGVDIVKSYSAFGGFDLDDRLVTTIQYDSTARRLLALTIRDPNEAGEYMFYDADISKMRQFSKEFIEVNGQRMSVSSAYARHRSLTGQIAQSQNSLQSRQRLLYERDQLSNALDNYFRNKQDIVKVDIGRMFDPSRDITHIATPKGFARDANALEAWRYSAATSFLPSSDFGGEENAVNLIASEISQRLSKGNPLGASPFRYVSKDYSEWHSKYFTQIRSSDLEALMQGARPGTMEELLQERIVQEFESRGLLGQATNLRSVIDDFMKSNLKGLPNELQIEFDKILKGKNFQHIEHELVIDTAKKTGAKAVLDVIDSMMHANASELGRTIALMRKKAIDLGYDPASIGLDPVLAAQRIESNQSFTNSILKGFSTQAKALGIDGVRGIQDLTLTLDDPKAFIAKQLKEQLSIADEILPQAKEEVLTSAREGMRNALSGITFTPEETMRASEFISHMADVNRDLNALINPDSEMFDEYISRMLESADDIHIDDANMAALRKLKEFGLSGEGLDRQLLAIANVLTENNASLSPLMSMGEDIDSSMATLFTEAMKRMVYGPKTIKEINRIPVLSEGLEKFIGLNEFGEVEYREASKIYDPAQRGVALLQRIASTDPLSYDDEFSGRLQKYVDFIHADMQSSKQFDPVELNGYYRAVMARVRDKRTAQMNGVRSIRPPSYSAPVQQGLPDLPAGTGRFTRRATADDAADFVASMGREEMTRFDKEFVKKLWSEPLGKGLIIGTGIFAGIGIVHRLTKNPTPEEAGGPPMLPAGSPYEDYDQVGYSAVSSMYPSFGGTSSAGMQYTVSTSSGYDPRRLSTNLSDITGGSATTNIYTSRRTVGKKAYSSRDILKDRRG